MQTFQYVLDAARELTTADRLRLVEVLWGEVPPSEWPAPTDEWIAEVQRRSAALDEGTMTVSTWPEVRDRARKQAGLND